MISRNEWFILVVSIFVVSLVLLGSYYLARARRSSEETWESLLGRLMAVDRDNIAIIAADSDFDIEKSRISSMIGGMSGLEALESNCDVLIDLACHVQNYYPEALVIAEDLRLKAREIKWHLGRIKSISNSENLQANFDDYARRAISVYYRMTQSVLALYERGNLPGLTELRRAI
jgi:hypothetical protein